MTASSHSDVALGALIRVISQVKQKHKLTHCIKLRTFLDIQGVLLLTDLGVFVTELHVQVRAIRGRARTV